MSNNISYADAVTAFFGTPLNNERGVWSSSGYEVSNLTMQDGQLVMIVKNSRKPICPVISMRVGTEDGREKRRLVPSEFDYPVSGFVPFFYHLSTKTRGYIVVHDNQDAEVHNSLDSQVERLSSQPWD